MKPNPAGRSAWRARISRFRRFVGWASVEVIVKLRRANRSLLSLFSTGILFLCPLVALSQSEDRAPEHRVAPWNVKAVSSRSLEIGGATIQVDFAFGTLALDTTSILSWIQDAANAVSHYYGRFPVHRVRILIVPVP